MNKFIVVFICVLIIGVVQNVGAEWHQTGHSGNSAPQNCNRQSPTHGRGDYRGNGGYYNNHHPNYSHYGNRFQRYEGHHYRYYGNNCGYYNHFSYGYSRPYRYNYSVGYNEVSVGIGVRITPQTIVPVIPVVTTPVVTTTRAFGWIGQCPRYYSSPNGGTYYDGYGNWYGTSVSIGVGR